MQVSRPYAWLLIAPLLLSLALFLAYPSVFALKLAFTDPLSGSFPSLANLELLSRDPLFWRAARNNAILPVCTVALEIVAGLSLALFLSRRFPGRRALRAIVVLPFALPEIVVLTMMRYIFVSRGYANAALLEAGLPTVEWLRPGSPLAFFTVVVVDAWHITPVVFLMMLAALTAIPQEVTEAAELDGAGRWARLRWIVLPLLRPAILAALLLRGVDALRVFAAPLVLTGVEGIPVLSTYAYHQWSDYGNDTAAAAASSALALLCVLFSVPLLRQRAPA